MNGDEFYEKIELTEEEMKAAILEGKKKKYFHEKHKGDWEMYELPKKKKPFTIQTNTPEPRGLI